MRPADIMRMEPTGVAEIVPRTRTCSKSPAALPAAVPLLGSGGVTLDWLKGSIAFVTTAPTPSNLREPLFGTEPHRGYQKVLEHSTDFTPSQEGIDREDTLAW